MSEFSEHIWKKALDLQAVYAARGEALGWRRLAKELGLKKRTADLVSWALSQRGIISQGSAIKKSVVVTKSLQDTRKALRDAEKQIESLYKEVQIHVAINGMEVNPPTWTIPASPGKKDGIVCVALSDTHWDEVVRPGDVMGVNAYNREIATTRFECFVKNIIKLKRGYITGVNIKGLALFILGDMVSGLIHEELVETNEYNMVETIIYWTEQLIAALLLLLEEFKVMTVVGVAGNHGRLTPKMRFKGAARHNWDYLLYHLVAKDPRISGQKGITFNIPDSADAIIPVYDTVYCITHGNQFRGGGGWMGPLGPYMRGDRKKRERQSAIKKPYDIMVGGHFHTLQHLTSIIMNGSIVGYNEYAMDNNLPFEKPQQAFWLTDPEHGKTIAAPIRCRPDKEPWEE